MIPYSGIMQMLFRGSIIMARTVYLIHRRRIQKTKKHRYNLSSYKYKRIWGIEPSNTQDVEVWNWKHRRTRGIEPDNVGRRRGQSLKPRISIPWRFKPSYIYMYIYIYIYIYILTIVKMYIYGLHFCMIHKVSFYVADNKECECLESLKLTLKTRKAMAWKSGNVYKLNCV
jgi:hypothetical protein